MRLPEHANVERFDERREFERGALSAQLALDLGRTSMQFARVERVPRYADGERENDAEHSFMLGLVAPEIAEALQLPLDIGLVSRYASIHDLVELKTLDLPTFLFTEDQQLQKELDEQAALRTLLAELPAHTSRLLARYETQIDPEARFVRYIDKLLPVVVDVIGPGERVMAEDYGVANMGDLSRCHADLHARITAKFGGEFPEIDLAHRLLIELFEAKYAESVEAGLA